MLGPAGDQGGVSSSGVPKLRVICEELDTEPGARTRRRQFEKRWVLRGPPSLLKKKRGPYI